MSSTPPAARVVDALTRACEGGVAEGCWELAEFLRGPCRAAECRRDVGEIAALVERACAGGVVDACTVDRAELERGFVRRACTEGSLDACATVATTEHVDDVLAADVVRALREPCREVHSEEVSCEVFGSEPVAAQGGLCSACRAGVQSACAFERFWPVALATARTDCESGDARACWLAGTMAAERCGTEDVGDAIAMLRRACVGGVSAACFQHGLYHADEGFTAQPRPDLAAPAAIPPGPRFAAMDAEALLAARRGRDPWLSTISGDGARFALFGLRGLVVVELEHARVVRTVPALSERETSALLDGGPLRIPVRRLAAIDGFLVAGGYRPLAPLDDAYEPRATDGATGLVLVMSPLADDPAAGIVREVGPLRVVWRDHADERDLPHALDPDSDCAHPRISVDGAWLLSGGRLLVQRRFEAGADWCHPTYTWAIEAIATEVPPSTAALP